MIKKQTSGDTYCGADRGIFKWSQTISDLDVVLNLAPTIQSPSDIRVKTCSDNILVQLQISQNNWETILEDSFTDKIKPDEVVWTYEPGKLSIHLEKQQEKWWDSFLTKEPKINLQEMELTRPVSDLSEEEEMTLQKLWNEQLEKICKIKSES
ncbi:Nuclear movement protein nudC, putative [Pediculus humanus corporis]|uniref:Nuclear movement protein nudC, putative n=1 Tax=Pediculus humanus subsp. corporis TaxID=121224 RepID=E0VU42_PEDHC|nr:Nuclear movement protein nudC, putative [Pediculus humanus corporis]EEB16898.1 Nuclear movement protein nudC, putative [Pediculus humanus corporis]